MLTQQQLQHFQTFGFLHLKKVFDADELKIIIAEYEKGLAFAREGATQVGGRRQLNWPNMGPRTPHITKLLEDPRICGVAEQLLGEDMVAVGTNGNHFGGNFTEWHPDIDSQHLRGIKFLSYLQPLDGNSGALRVIPGSHLSPFHDEVYRITMKEHNYGDGEESGLSVAEVPAFVCKTEPSDLIVFNLRTWHATWGGTADRRMCSFNYYANPKTPEEQEATRAMVAIDRQVQKSLKWKEPQYAPEWIANPDSSPKRQRWIMWLTHWGFIEVAG